MDDKPSVKELLSRSPADIVSFLSGIYEHSPWVAEGLVSEERNYRDLATVTRLSEAMKKIVEVSAQERKQALLQAHPDLCEKVGKLESLTKESQEEQSRSGLQSLTEDELSRFTMLNTRYRKKFGFPFILAVRNATKHTVLAALVGRVENSTQVEFCTALQQVHKIAWMRLLAALDTADAKGFLTCHVLDTGNGCPGTLRGDVSRKARLQLILVVSRVPHSKRNENSAPQIIPA
jgi:2-oxo-4-hydroxy-4-carboxy-5-ureidoimidazoline decarboxylase